jgi:hypothetical protein
LIRCDGDGDGVGVGVGVGGVMVVVVVVLVLVSVVVVVVVVVVGDRFLRHCDSEEKEAPKMSEAGALQSHLLKIW